MNLSCVCPLHRLSDATILKIYSGTNRKPPVLFQKFSPTTRIGYSVKHSCGWESVGLTRSQLRSRLLILLQDDCVLISSRHKISPPAENLQHCQPETSRRRPVWRQKPTKLNPFVLQIVFAERRNYPCCSMNKTNTTRWMIVNSGSLAPTTTLKDSLIREGVSCTVKKIQRKNFTLNLLFSIAMCFNHENNQVDDTNQWHDKHVIVWGYNAKILIINIVMITKSLVVKKLLLVLNSNFIAPN